MLISESVPAGEPELVLGNVIVNVPFEQDFVPPKSKTTTNLSLAELLYITPKAAPKVAFSICVVHEVIDFWCLW